MAQDWHRRIYRNIRAPVPYYAGEIRNSDPDFPELFGYEVAVGSSPGESGGGRYPKSSNKMFSGSTPRSSSIFMHAWSIIGGPHR